MSDEEADSGDSKPGPDESMIDEELERELDEALGEMSLEEILQAEAAPDEPAAGGVRRGTVAAIHGEDVFVDMGGKSQGVVPLQQFDDEDGHPKAGDVIEVTIEGYDRRDGLLLLSRQGAVKAATWENLDEGQVVEGRVTGHNKGGLELTVNGIRAFMPISQIEMFRVEDISGYVNQRLRCQVMEVDRSDRNVIVSRRALLEAEAAEVREKLLASLEEGQTVVGVVRSIMPYGAFVDIGGVDGLLHVSDMSYSRVEDPAHIVHEGQQIEVKVLKFDREERKISLGLKQTMPDPWSDAEVKWPVDSVVGGRVTRLVDFGAFVELQAGVEGLIPISELSFGRRIGHPSEILREGDMVKVRVLNVDSVQRRIGLSLRRVADDPWTGASVRWPVHTVVEGIVTRIADFGAFVELAPGVEGLIHISELSYSHVRAVGHVVREGDTVQAKVLNVDEDKRRISLSVKQLGYATGKAEAATTESQAPRAQRKRKGPLKGGLDR